MKNSLNFVSTCLKVVDTRRPTLLCNQVCLDTYPNLNVAGTSLPLRIDRLPDPPAAESNLRLKRRAHGPLTGIVLIEIAGCDVVVHAGADIPRRHLNLESAMESLGGRRFVAGLLLEELDRDRIGVGDPGG